MAAGRKLKHAVGAHRSMSISTLVSRRPHNPYRPAYCHRGPLFHVMCVRDSRQGLCVRDNGMGIAKKRDELTRFFRYFGGYLGFGRHLARTGLPAGNGTPVALFSHHLSRSGTSGAVLAQRLRQSSFNTATPIVIFSPSTDPRDAGAAKRCGVDNYHVKPVVLDEFP